MTAKQITCIVLLFAGLMRFTIAQHTNVPSDRHVYSFLVRMQAKGLIDSYELRTTPLPRNTIADLLGQVLKNASERPSAFTKTDQKLLRRFLGDFRHELSPEQRKHAGALEPHIFKLADESGRMVIDLIGSQEILANHGNSSNASELLSQTMGGARIRGKLGSRIGFFTEAQNQITRGESAQEQFDASSGNPVVTSGANVIRDRAVAYIVWQAPWLRLQAGRDEISWGPSLRYNPAISYNMPPADQIKLSTRWKPFKFTSTHAWLRNDLGSKYLASHRLDVRVSSGLYVGVGESVIYGARSIEPAYLNPLMLYHVAEHHLGDKDNNTLFIDATVTRISNISLYAQWFIDDMTSTRSWTHYFGNKFAFLIGGLWVDAFGLNNLNLSAEYTHVDPFVYSHTDSINIYTHYDKIIGHPIGPNSDAVYLSMDSYIYRDLFFKTFFEQIRQADGHADTESYPEQGESKNFLKSVYETQYRFGFKLRNQIKRDLYLSISCTWLYTRNTNKQKGVNKSDRIGQFRISFNY